jgi:hypothetical protein
MKHERIPALFIFCLLGMELAYLYLPASLLAGTFHIRILMLLPYPVSLLFVHASSREFLSRRSSVTLESTLVALVALAVAGERLLGGAATESPDVAGIVARMGFCGLAWLLGRTVPRGRTRYPAVAFRLQIGIVAVLAFSQAAGSALPAILFFLFAPSALFTARWVCSFSRGASPIRVPKGRHLLFAAAGVCAPGAIVTLSLTPDVARAVVDWLSGASLKVSNWLDAQHRAAASPPGSFKFTFGCAVRPPQAALQIAPPEPPPSLGPPAPNLLFVWIVVFAFLSAAAAFAALALKKRQVKRGSPAAVPVRFGSRAVSVRSIADLMALLQRLLRKLRSRFASLFRRSRARTDEPEIDLPALRVIYRKLLRWAAIQGATRGPAQTPLEHLAMLERKFPGHGDDLKHLTGAYMSVRYGRGSVSREGFRRAEEAWRRVAAFHPRPRVKG